LAGWLLRGRCSACKTRISARYPLVELATGLLFAAVAWRFGPQPVALLYCAVVAALLWR
jgi:leader peptidase (prepilin peptidase)/N-methyltransferase